MKTNRLSITIILFTIIILYLFQPFYTNAKPGGHKYVMHHCKATFQFTEKYQSFVGNEPLQLYLAGSGFASFNGVPIYGNFDIRNVLYSSGIAMQWEVNNCFAGNKPEWGIITATANTWPKTSERSSIVFSSHSENTLFPATSVNQLFFNIEIPIFDLVIFNKEPIVLLGSVRNINLAEDVEKDLRVVNRGISGLSTDLRSMLNAPNRLEIESQLFEPIGQHSLIKPVSFYRKDNPDEVVCTLIGSELQVGIHYGVDIKCVENHIDGAFITSTLEIKNLTPKVENCIWYVADSHELEIVAVEYLNEMDTILTNLKFGKIKLGKNPFRIKVQAYNTNPKYRLGENACIFFGVQNTPEDLNAFKTDLISGFLIVQGNDFRKFNK